MKLCVGFDTLFFEYVLAGRFLSTYWLVEVKMGRFRYF